MKEEDLNKKRMEEISGKIKDNQEEIKDTITPGAYFYDTKKVEKLQDEIKILQEEYETLEKRPTREKLESIINNLKSQLNIVNEEIKDYSGAYAIVDEMQETFDKKAELTEKLDYHTETLNIVDEIEKLEKELDDLKEEEQDYIGANFIPDEILKEKEDKEIKLEELKKKLSERTLSPEEIKILKEEGLKKEPTQKTEEELPLNAKNIVESSEKKPSEELRKPKENVINTDKVLEGLSVDGLRAKLGPADRRLKEAGENLRVAADHLRPEGKGETPLDISEDKGSESKIHDAPESTLAEDLEIRIGRKATIMYKGKKNTISKLDIQEGLELDTADTFEMIEEIGIPTDIEYKNEVAKCINAKIIDSVVINALYRAEEIEDADKRGIIRQYVEEAVKANKGELTEGSKCNIKYDYKDLSKTNLWELFLGSEMDINARNEILDRATIADEIGLAKTEGKYKPSLATRFMAFLHGQKIKKLEAPKEKVGGEKGKTKEEVKPKTTEGKDQEKSRDPGVKLGVKVDIKDIKDENKPGKTEDVKPQMDKPEKGDDEEPEH